MKMPLLFSANIRRSRLFFIDRSRQGTIWRQRDLGARVELGRDNLRTTLAAQNGGDGAGSDMLLAGRLEWTMVGHGMITSEYPAGTDAPTQLVLAVAVADEGTLDDGTVLAADLTLVTGPLFAHAEIVDYDDGFVLGALTGGGALFASGSAGTTPSSLTLGRRFSERWDAAARFQWVDDSDDTWSLRLGCNRSMLGGALRWQFNLIQRGSADPAREGQRLAVGLFWTI